MSSHVLPTYPTPRILRLFTHHCVADFIKLRARLNRSFSKRITAQVTTRSDALELWTPEGEVELDHAIPKVRFHVSHVLLRRGPYFENGLSATDQDVRGPIIGLKLGAASHHNVRRIGGCAINTEYQIHRDPRKGTWLVVTRVQVDAKRIDFSRPFASGTKHGRTGW